MFIAIEGSDGAGKSTQFDALVEWLRQTGQTVTVCRDPGTTATGEAVRDVLLHREDLAIDRRAEMFLFMAARAQMVAEVIRPAIERGEVVISDRFLLSNVVYQGHAGGLSLELLWEIGAAATAGLMPDLTIVLDVDRETAASRLSGEPDRMERMGDAFHERVREGFLQEAKHPRHPAALIDTRQSIEKVKADIRAVVGPLLGELRPRNTRIRFAARALIYLFGTHPFSLWACK